MDTLALAALPAPSWRKGQIDQILSSSPKNAAPLFEEAAGILKFKREKGRLRKLDTQTYSGFRRAHEQGAE
jgi:hypothetical protein